MSAMNKKQLRMAIVGCGTWGSVHAKILDRHPDVQLAALVDFDKAKAESLASTLQSKVTIYQRLDELFRQDPLIDAVTIAVPDPVHLESIIKSVAANKHILVEKPLTTTVSDAQACLKALEGYQKTFMVNFHLRWMTPFYKAWEAITSGKIGQPQFCRFEQSNSFFVPTKMLSWASKSNALWFLGIHSVDMLQWLMGSRVARVYCVSRRNLLEKQGITTEDSFVSTLEFQNGATASLENLWILPNNHPTIGTCRCNIVGSEGCMNIDAINNGGLRMIQDQQGFSDANLFGLNSIDAHQIGSPVLSISHFIRCALTGDKPIVTIEDAVSSVKIIAALEQSAHFRKPVDII